MTSKSVSIRSQAKTTGWVLLLPSSERWTSAITAITAQEQVATKQFASIDALLDSLPLYQPCVVVADLTSLSPTDLSQFLKAAGTPVFKSPLFAVGAVGDNGLHDARIDLIQLGFSELFTSTGETERLVRMAKDYFENAKPVTYPIEELVDRDLPW